MEARAAYQRTLVDDFLMSRRATVSATTVQVAVTALRSNLLPWLEAHGRYVWEATPEDLDRWAVSLKHSVKARTHQHYFIHVDQFYSWLVARRRDEVLASVGVEPRNPVDAFNRARRLPEGDRLVPVPREEVIQYFLAASRHRVDTARSDTKWLQACRDYCLWMVMNWAGLRRMEVAELARDDVDLVAGIIQVREGKGGKGRIVHVQPELAPVLRWYVHDVRPQAPCAWRNALLFLNAGQRGHHPDGITNLLHQRQVEARVPSEDQFTCHGFRRAYATRLYKALRAQGFRDPLVYVKEQLGHVYLTTTQRYCQLDDDYRYFLMKEAGEALASHYESRRSERGRR